jgi:hypothetical protein
LKRFTLDFCVSQRLRLESSFLDPFGELAHFATGSFADEVFKIMRNAATPALKDGERLS